MIRYETAYESGTTIAAALAEEHAQTCPIVPTRDIIETAGVPRFSVSRHVRAVQRT